MAKENRFRRGRNYLKRDAAKLRNVKRNALEGRPFGASRKTGYCDTDLDGFPDLFIKNYRNPAVRKSTECDYSEFAKLGLLEPTLLESSGGTCESTDASNNIEGLYCPDLEYGGFFQTTFYHNAKASPYSGQPSHILTTNFKSAIFDDVVLDDWYHVAFTRSGYTGAMYINGQLISVSTIMKNTALKSNPSSIRIGAVFQSNWKNDNTFNGKIDQPAVWDRNLSGSEISQLYNNGSGHAYNLWSDSLKTAASHVIEFGAVRFAPDELKEHVGSATLQFYNSDANAVTNTSDFTVEGGKVSPRSFSPVYRENGSTAITRSVIRKALVINKGLGAGTNASWTLSGWVSPHGHGATSSGAAADFNYNGESYKRAYGTIFSEYTAYQNWSQTSPDANFSVSFNGLI